MARETREQQTTALQLLVALFAGVVGVLLSLWAFSSLVGPQATHDAAIRRMADFIYWTQPLIYLGAGMMAGRGDAQAGPFRAPVIGLVLAALGYVIVRKFDLLPAGSTIPSYMMTAGALFGMVGAVLTALIDKHTNTAVGLILLVGFVAYAVNLFNLSSLVGQVQREVVQRAEGMTVSMQTEQVRDVPLWLLDPETRAKLYHTKSNSSGRYRFSKVPPGDYILHTMHGYGRDRGRIEMTVKAARTITGDTPYDTLVLPAVVHEAGNIFE